ncbi:PREDICTED: galactoside 2-alpha-L-fucosyltransferase 2-like [Elephantulus edwardii]|uniref:galactoside 2-alpha-L-fucosyltransferase 2-like n=1 Tax=Elephantulus edwardii TaxID=28737 RepID=UPI0003F0B798|nr:PREDICTED: galactoside 2-alpha-L-fucosyltransferase 2-like [Elephantulus edwardii]
MVGATPQSLGWVSDCVIQPPLPSSASGCWAFSTTIPPSPEQMGEQMSKEMEKRPASLAVLLGPTEEPGCSSAAPASFPLLLAPHSGPGTWVLLDPPGPQAAFPWLFASFSILGDSRPLTGQTCAPEESPGSSDRGLSSLRAGWGSRPPPALCHHNHMEAPAGQPPAGWSRRFTAGITGLRAVCPDLSKVYVLLVIFTMATIFHCYQRMAPVSGPWAYPMHVVLLPEHLPQEGAWTINSIGRLGNQMGQYATLYALAKMNGRPAFIPAQMHRTLAPVFRITLPVLPSAVASRIPWVDYRLKDWMEDKYRNIPGRYVHLTGYPCSWTFYHHLRAEILSEFTLHGHLRQGAQRLLGELQAQRARTVTFVGVHVRRGDYLRVMPQVWRGVLADPGYLQRALDWFRARHRDCVFVVTSDDMAWCRRHINASLGDVVFAGKGLQGSPARDFALLTQCNHTIMTIGTFGFWAAYLAGGDTVYLDNFTLPDSPFRLVFRPKASFLPEWVGMAANLGP